MHINIDKIVNDYMTGNLSMVKIGRKYHISNQRVRNILSSEGVEIKKVGQKYHVPDEKSFAKDCEELRWWELEEKYGVSWSIIKSWKKKLGLTTGVKQDRKVVYVERENGCWECKSHKSAKEYPRGNKGELIAKRLWAENNTVWPKNKLLRHLCDNKWCVNPHHVIPGTSFENMVDCVLDGKGKKEQAFINSILSRAFKRGIIGLTKEGNVIRTIDNKVFEIFGEIESQVVIEYNGKFMNGGGEV